MIELYRDDNHANLMVNDLSEGYMVDANQHIIQHNGETMVLDPGGHKVFNKFQAILAAVTPMKQLKYLFFSHQDPDIIAAANGWLMTTDAVAYLPRLWMRFITHFGIDKMVLEQIKPIEDGGMVLDLGGVGIKLVPAHFLHSAGNFQVYDPVAKILYSGDLGASLGASYAEVPDFDAHIPYMKGFHQRYMPTNQVFKMWAKTVRQLDIELIAPQHGAIFRGKEMVGRFIDWIEALDCGVDLMGESYPIPK